MCVCVCVCVCVRSHHLRVRVCVCVATVSGYVPGGVPTAASQSVSLSGAAMPDVSGDNGAFVIAVSCSAPNATAPLVVGNSWVTSTWASGSAILLSVSGSGAVAGVYELCVRWSSVSPYFAAGTFDLLSVTSVVPSVISARSGSQQIVGVSGAGLLNVSSDGGAFVISRNCSVVMSVVTSVWSVFVNSTSVTLNVNAGGATAGVYSLCMREAATSVYFWSGATVTIGECVCVCVCVCV